jgi:phospholipid/cholesterol/gamma-HCH transport system ATP-binding protein
MNAPTPEAAVLVRSVHKSFGAQHVLDGVDLEVAQGETLAILGQSGTGKSVLLKLIVGLQQVDEGSIRIHGQELAGIDLKPMNELRQKIGFVFQSAALYDSMTVEENVAFPLKRHAQLSDADCRTQVHKLLASVGMEEALGKMPDEISGGMKKRVGLARALALSPDILLFDEPTTGLDPITSAEIGELILKLQRERKVASIIVTHDVRVAQMVANRLALLADGRILVTGTFEDLKHSHDAFTSRFLSSAWQG